MRGLKTMHLLLAFCAVGMLSGAFVSESASRASHTSRASHEESPAVGNALAIGPPVSPPSAAWVIMPEGGKNAYIGIHGGTMPVSLLTASDGQSMLTLVGRTGNDFLALLRNTSLHQPSGIPYGGNAPERNATVLMADTAIGSVPVFYHTGMGFARVDLHEQQWLPFGLSEKPLRLEGQVERILPAVSSGKSKKHRRFQWQQRIARPVIATR